MMLHPKDIEIDGLKFRWEPISSENGRQIDRFFEIRPPWVALLALPQERVMTVIESLALMGQNKWRIIRELSQPCSVPVRGTTAFTEFGSLELAINAVEKAIGQSQYSFARSSHISQLETYFSGAKPA